MPYRAVAATNPRTACTCSQHSQQPPAGQGTAPYSVVATRSHALLTGVNANCLMCPAGLQGQRVLGQLQVTTTPAQLTATPWQQHQLSACPKHCCKAPVLAQSQTRTCQGRGTTMIPARTMQELVGVHQRSVLQAGRSGGRTARCSGTCLDLGSITGRVCYIHRDG